MLYRSIQANPDIMLVILLSLIPRRSGSLLVPQQPVQCSYLGLRLVLKVTAKRGQAVKRKQGKDGHKTI